MKATLNRLIKHQRLTKEEARQMIINIADDEPCAQYRDDVRRELVADDRMARILIPLLAKPTVAGAALKATGATAWTRRNFARWMFEDYPRAMIATPRRWHRGMFTGPGAYQDADR